MSQAIGGNVKAQGSASESRCGRALLRVGEFRQLRRDLPAASRRDALITHRRGRGAVAQSLHQFGDGGAADGGQHSTGMAKVVEAQIRSTRKGPGFVPVPVHRAWLQVALWRIRHAQDDLVDKRFDATISHHTTGVVRRALASGVPPDKRVMDKLNPAKIQKPRGFR